MGRKPHARQPQPSTAVSLGSETHKAGLGGIALARLARSDVAAWYESLAQGGTLSRRSIQIMRMTLRAAMANAVASGELRRNVAAHVPMPRDVKCLPKTKVADAWDSDEIERFVAVTRDHRWGGPILLQLMYGLRRSELLALYWSNVDLDAGTVAIVAGLVESDGRLVWSDGKNARSPPHSGRPRHDEALREHGRRQAAERLRAGEAWDDSDLVVANHTGGPGASAQLQPHPGHDHRRGRSSTAHLSRTAPHGRDPHGHQRRRPR